MSSSDVSKNLFVQGKNGGVKIVWTFCNVSYCSSVLLLTCAITPRSGIGLGLLWSKWSGTVQCLIKLWFGSPCFWSEVRFRYSGGRCLLGLLVNNGNFSCRGVSLES